MNILHAGWLPLTDKPTRKDGFENPGRFVLWVESSSPHHTAVTGRRNRSDHPNHISDKTLLDELFSKQLKLNKATLALLSETAELCHCTLPSTDSAPLPSVEMTQFNGETVTNEPQWRRWRVNVVAVSEPLPFLKELALSLQQTPTVHAGYDLQFWIQYADQLRRIIRQQLYLPVLKAYPSGKKTLFKAGWEPLSQEYELCIRQFTAAMPVSARMLYNHPKTGAPYSAASLLRHFSEQQIDQLARTIPITKKLDKELEECWVTDALANSNNHTVEFNQKLWNQARDWQAHIVGNDQEGGFSAGMQLSAQENSHQEESEQSERGNGETRWLIEFFIESRIDPSLRLTLEEVWALNSKQRRGHEKLLGSQFEKMLLIALGQAARIAPLLWQGMEVAEPTGFTITLDQAYNFLCNDAPILESAGFKIRVPTWWTPKGRQRARIQVRASASSKSTSQSIAQDSGGFFDLPSIINYRYELAIGDQPVTEEEWQLLVNAKTPLVQFRGEWIEVDSGQMEEMLRLMKSSEAESTTPAELIQQVAEADEEKLSFLLDEALQSMMDRLLNREDSQQLTLLEQPPGLNGTLRGYQQQGFSWLSYQQALGFHPILADDMGLGKTIQVIALLLQEQGQRQKQKQEQKQEQKQAQAQPHPTLLIAPTSVLGNWQKEVTRFAPQLTAHIHHGSQREKKPEPFEQLATTHNLFITSYALARRDSKLITAIQWHRVVLDEAQNIKNPKSAQTRAIQKINATHRLALTGTPIENRLMDLWSIFQFLNPGFLGTTTQFKKGYETPIQRENNLQRSAQLRKLVSPFILRRLKTDRNIIDDLPEKIEQKVYCNLTQEQASLYQAVVDEVSSELEEAEGIQRKGLMLSTLMKLKQICNHPAQFLQDQSTFSRARSHKLARVEEMIEEALQEGDSLLIFTQFTEVGAALERQLREQQQCPVYYLHGGTRRNQREQMIETFQDEQSPAGIFILSLKAGGVGITLTRANHVFHFDRWWNPAVENQATDRAFRIGQKKRVFAHKMVTLGTLEERIDQMIEEKQQLADSIVGSDESWLTEMDNESFTRLIQLNRNTIMEVE